MYRIFLASSDAWYQGTAFGGWDLEVKDEAIARGPPKFSKQSSSSFSQSSTGSSAAQLARKKLGKRKVSKGYCWLYHAEMPCDGNCGYKHVCDRCPSNNNRHTILSCKMPSSTFPRPNHAPAANDYQQHPPPMPNFNFSTPPPAVPPPLYPNSSQQFTFNATPSSSRNQQKPKFWTNPK